MTYAKIVEIPAETYAEYERLCDTGNYRELARWCANFADEWIDIQRDWLDADEFDDVEIEPYVEKAPAPVAANI